jgi:hypothetical protein
MQRGKSDFYPFASIGYDLSPLAIVQLSDNFCKEKPRPRWPRLKPFANELTRQRYGFFLDIWPDGEVTRAVVAEELPAHSVVHVADAVFADGDEV